MGLVPLTLEPSHLLTFKIGMSRMIANFLFETQILNRSQPTQLGTLKERGYLSYKSNLLITSLIAVSGDPESSFIP